MITPTIGNTKARLHHSQRACAKGTELQVPTRNYSRPEGADDLEGGVKKVYYYCGYDWEGDSGGGCYGS